MWAATSYPGWIKNGNTNSVPELWYKFVTLRIQKWEHLIVFGRQYWDNNATNSETTETECIIIWGTFDSLWKAILRLWRYKSWAAKEHIRSESIFRVPLCHLQMPIFFFECTGRAPAVLRSRCLEMIPVTSWHWEQSPYSLEKLYLEPCPRQPLQNAFLLKHLETLWCMK